VHSGCNVRFGSFASILTYPLHVRLPADLRHRSHRTTIRTCRVVLEWKLNQLVFPPRLAEFPQRYTWDHAIPLGRRTTFFVWGIGFGAAKDRHRVTEPTAFLAGGPFPFDVRGA
jgi:hypothetical protein